MTKKDIWGKLWGETNKTRRRGSFGFPRGEGKT